jgi:hypothetical protein
MTDRLLNSAWWLTVMGMICAAAATALFVGYRGIFDLLAQRWSNGMTCLIISACAAFGAYQLCRYRNELL